MSNRTAGIGLFGREPLKVGLLRQLRQPPRSFLSHRFFLVSGPDPRFAGLLLRMIISALPPIRPETRSETPPAPRGGGPPAVWQWPYSSDLAGAAASRKSG